MCSRGRPFLGKRWETNRQYNNDLVGAVQSYKTIEAIRSATTAVTAATHAFRDVTATTAAATTTTAVTAHAEQQLLKAREQQQQHENSSNNTRAGTPEVDK